MIDQAPVLIIVIPLIFALLTPVVGLWRKSLCYFWILTALALSAAFSVTVFVKVLNTGTIHYNLGGWTPPWGIEYVIDHLNALMLVVVSAIALLTAVYSRKSIEKEFPNKKTAFYTVFLLQATGFLGIVITGDMFNLYVFLEISSLAGYALIAIGEDGALFAAFKYIIIGTIGASFYLIGVGYIYIMTGSLNMADIAALLQQVNNTSVIHIAFAFILAGLIIKMALFPMYIWMPDAYTKAPSASSALIAPLMTKISAYILVRVIFTIFKPEFITANLPVTKIMLWLGFAAIIYGAIMSIAQTDFKRMLCFIIVAEIGYIVGGIGLFNPTAIKGAILHILNDAVMTAGLFFIAGIVKYKTGFHNLTDFKDLFKKMPVTMGAFVIIALSVIGVPPTCGFFSKWYLIKGAIIGNAWPFAAALLFSSLVNVVLFFRIFEIGYGFDHGHDSGGHEELGSGSLISEAPATMLLPSMLVSLIIIFTGIYNQTIITNIIEHVTPNL
ncbi:MAG: monovalent cation/H+ antiporter subunit D family protein [Spirochaetes bacterium]|nr:monovalent cation/H+ antiporter subunit D family protein [Spirochaetota bacterium]